MKGLYRRAARRVLAVPMLITLLWGLQLVAGAVSGAITAWMTRNALGPFGAPTDDGHAIYRLAELLSFHPAIATAVLSATAVAAGLTWLLRTLAGGMIFAWLGGKTREEIGYRGLSRLPALLAQAGWHLLWSVPAMALAAIVTGPLPPLARVAILTALWSGTAVAYDRVRAQVCLAEEERPLHPKTALRAAKWAFTHASVWIAATALMVAQLASTAAVGWLALDAVGSSSGLWQIRLAALASLVFGLLRISLSIEATLGEPPGEPPSAEAES